MYILNQLAHDWIGSRDDRDIATWGWSASTLSTSAGYTL